MRPKRPSRRRGVRRLRSLRTLRREEVVGVSHETKRLLLPGKVPWGYHRLTVEAEGVVAEATVISAPTEAYRPPEYRDGSWGSFAPLYAFHTERSWGAGDFTDLETLIEWTSYHGSGVVSTLPFLAAFLDEPFDPSPYAPASRLFWNELYVDPTRISHNGSEGCRLEFCLLRFRRRRSQLLNGQRSHSKDFGQSCHIENSLDAT